MNDYERLAEEKREQYPYEYQAPYKGISKAVFKDVPGNYVWIPFKAEGYSLFLFDDEEDRDALAARYEDAAVAA